MSGIECEYALRRLRGDQEQPSDVDSAAALEVHVAGCADCRLVAAEERITGELLRAHLPRYEAPAALKRRLTQLARSDSEGTRAAHEPRAGVSSRRTRSAGWLAAAALLALALVALVRWRGSLADERDQLVNEAVNDHLRVLYAERPLEVESGGIHQVRPWFAGRLDFAPDLTFSGDDEFPLSGGAVGYFVDRKAAIFVFKRRLHTISLFAFRADGLPWPGTLDDHATPAARAGSARGFRWLLWRRGDLGYALVSDTEAATLARLAGKLGAPL